jgi:60 kDa SS-A/Ro ribonucleoprotein
MAMLAINQCEDYELVATAGIDALRKQASEHIKYPQKGFGVFKQIMDTRNNIGGGGIFTKQCLDWCKAKFKDVHFDRIIIFSDSQDIDYCYDKTILPEPFGKYNYICDVSSNLRGVNYRGRYTAEISGWSEHFLTYIAALEGLQNKFEEQ